jgi:uncharacterized SAM-binding protein YcdF (DUF218 family)
MTFGSEAVDQFDELELPGKVKESGGPAEGREAGAEGLGVRPLEALEQGIGRAQILQDDGAGTAVEAARLDEVVVGGGHG